ncbi:hypothetical protein CNY89_02675 [Amaricoccus sp. HAR-UPW-R2A-40]|nr:hypothetical protein CNY89_02675 [Amaricoccus sp. HAR-UPW-R2A-40]
MTIPYALRTLSRDPATAKLELDGIEAGERWDPQMTADEKAEVRAARLRVERELARKQGRRG